MRLKYLVFIIFVYYFNSLRSQEFSLLGMPEIKHYSFEEYQAGPQNWCIGQDPYGRMFFGNNYGLLRFDGLNWQLFPLENRSTLRSLAIDSLGNVYVGGSGEFGVFSPSADGKFNYRKISSDTLEIYFADVWSTHIYKDTVYFFAGKSNIFYYVDGKLNLVKNNHSFSNFRGFKTSSGVYAIDEKLGLAKIVDAAIVPLNQLKGISNYNIYAFFELDSGKRMAVSSLNGIFVSDNKKDWYKKNTFFDDYLQDFHPYHAIKLHDGNVLISTLLGGLIMVSADFENVSVFGKDNGLKANGIYKVFQDKEKNIWLASENGIEYLHYSSPIRKLGENNGLEGSINSTIYFDNKIYIGSYGGIFYLDVNEFKKSLFNRNAIKSLSKEYFFGLDFAKISTPSTNDSFLLASTLRSIVKIKNNRIELAESFYGAEDIEVNKCAPEFFAVASSEGINVFRLANNGASFKNMGKLFGFNYDTRRILFHSHGLLWVQTARDGLALIEITDFEQLEFKSYFFDEKNGLPEKFKNVPVLLDSVLLISTISGLYEIELDTSDYAKTKFKPTKKFGFDFSKDSLVIDFAFSHQNKIWGHGNNSFFYKDESNMVCKKPFFAITDVTEEASLTFMDENIVALGAHNTLYFYNDKKEKNYDFYFPPILNKIKINNLFIDIEAEKGGSEVYFQGNNRYVVNRKLGSNENNLSFFYAIPYYEYSSKLSYSFILEGYEDRWSDYTKETIARYTNLAPGHYIFRVKAQNVYGNISQELEVAFTIKRPWFLSVYSFMIYILLIISLIYLAIHMNSQRLIKQNKKLEELVKNRTLEIFQQKEEIQSQAEQLKSQAEMLKLSNIELRQLSLVAKGTSNSVLILDDKGNIEWWNSGFTKLFKYKFMKYQGSNFNKIKSKIRPDLEASINEIKQSRQPKVYTIHDEISPGEYIWFQTSITPVFEEDGSVFRYIVIDSDITQIKIAESEINNQKRQLEKQRDKIAHHNKEMTSSIEYASRIQQAMLPLPIFLEAIFSDFFVLNLPRDIVSGDFYWVSRVNNRTYLALGDCTGHGIPGAFLSLLGISFLNNIIQKNDDISLSPAEILNQLRERFIVSLHQRGKNGEGQDGMDVSLIMIDQDSNTLEFAGANNALYYFKDKSDVLHELKADKMPIGIHANDHLPFTNHIISISKGDIIYLFTDGYRDQFGGTDGKKFMTKRFKKLLGSVKDYNLHRQKQILTEIFQEWKMGFDQVDDILIFGIKL